MRVDRVARVFASITIASSIAHADTRADEAEALFREGRKAAANGSFEVACEKFSTSQKLQPAPGTLLNLADCEEARGDLSSAWRDFISVAGELSDSDERKPVALERARRLERTMPKLRVRVATTSVGARIWRDDVELGAAAIGLAMPVAEGAHVIVVREMGRRDHAYDVTVGRDGERDVEVEHGARIGERIAGLVVGGLGLASFAVAGVTGGFALALSSSNVNCAAICETQAHAFAVTTDVALGVGAALVVTGIVLLLWPHAPTRTVVGGISF